MPAVRFPHAGPSSAAAAENDDPEKSTSLLKGMRRLISSPAAIISEIMSESEAQSRRMSVNLA